MTEEIKPCTRWALQAKVFTVAAAAQMIAAMAIVFTSGNLMSAFAMLSGSIFWICCSLYLLILQVKKSC